MPCSEKSFEPETIDDTNTIGNFGATGDQQNNKNEILLQHGE